MTTIVEAGCKSFLQFELKELLLIAATTSLKIVRGLIRSGTRGLSGEFFTTQPPKVMVQTRFAMGVEVYIHVYIYIKFETKATVLVVNGHIMYGKNHSDLAQVLPQYVSRL